MKCAACVLASGVVTAVMLATTPAVSGRHVPVFVVIRDHAAVPPHVLRRATQLVTEVYRPLGIDVAWLQKDVDPQLTPAVRLTILRRTAEDQVMLGIDARGDRKVRVHLAHVLFKRVGDDAVTSKVLAYVMARLIGGALRSNAGAGSPMIIRADPRAVAQLDDGAPFFTPEEVQAIQHGAAALAQ